LNSLLCAQAGNLFLAQSNADAAGKELTDDECVELEALGVSTNHIPTERRKKLWLRIAQYVFEQTDAERGASIAPNESPGKGLSQSPTGTAAANLSSGEGEQQQQDPEGHGKPNTAPAGTVDMPPTSAVIHDEDEKMASLHQGTQTGDRIASETVCAAEGGGNWPDQPQDGDNHSWTVDKLRRNIRHAIGFVRQCDVIKIEDILPFFPENTHIDDFKEEICASLKDYNADIESLKHEMEEATRSAESIQNDIRELRNRFGCIASDQLCDLCGQPVLIRQFYLFPCQHVFHDDCLMHEMRKHLEPDALMQVDVLMKAIAELKRKPRHSNVLNENILRVKQRQQMKAELDNLVASQCIYCGDIMIKAVDNLFISPAERDQIESWAI